MFPEDLLESFPEECEALDIDEDTLHGCTGYDIERLADQCIAYRREKALENRIEKLEQALSHLQNVVFGNA